MKMSRLGASGKFPNNIERDLVKLLELPAPPIWVEIPIRCDTNRRDIKLQKFPVMCPHLLYHYLHAPCQNLATLTLNSYNIFALSFCIYIYYIHYLIYNIYLYNYGHFTLPTGANKSEESGKLVRQDAAIKEYWRHTTQYGWHPKDHPGVSACANPCGLYGDDCRYNKGGEKLVVMNFNTLLMEPKSYLAHISSMFYFLVSLFLCKNTYVNTNCFIALNITSEVWIFADFQCSPCGSAVC